MKCVLLCISLILLSKQCFQVVSRNNPRFPTFCNSTGMMFSSFGERKIYTFLHNFLKMYQLETSPTRESLSVSCDSISANCLNKMETFYIYWETHIWVSHTNLHLLRDSYLLTRKFACLDSLKSSLQIIFEKCFGIKLE